MLDIGFADAMETILKSVKEQRSDTAYQTLLFSATLPDWVATVTKKYLQPNHKTVDLVGSQKLKTSESIQHYAIQCQWHQRQAAIGDIIGVYGGGQHGRTIIFTETKKEANEMALSSARFDCQVLHGDIAQNQREVTLQAFREGTCRVLVATDVAARGLDIPEVDLVIQCQPPKDVDTFVHRSGRTGRAGKRGVCVTFFKPQEEYLVKQISKQTGADLKRIGAPQKSQIVQAAALSAVKSLDQVSPAVIPYFLPIAKNILAGEIAIGADQSENDFEGATSRMERVLALALATLSGHVQPPKDRSLISCNEGFATLLMRLETPIRAVSYIRNILSKQFPDISSDQWKFMQLLKDSKGAAFDVASDRVADILKRWQEQNRSATTTLEVAESLPELMEFRFDPGSNGHQRGRQSNNNYRSSGFQSRGRGSGGSRFGGQRSGAGFRRSY